MIDIKSGVWPTMITPYTKENKIDYTATEELIEWYIKAGVAGIFTVCLSSEMYHLSPDERKKLAEFTVNKVKGRVQVVASGNVSEDRESHADEMKKTADIGVDAVVLLTNNIAEKGDSEDAWKNNIENIFSQIPKDITFGLYECPVPYKYLVSPKLIKWCAETERFAFLKETSCDISKIIAKQEKANGSKFKIFNANASFLSKSYEVGIEGYCGVLGNFFPELFTWHHKNFMKSPEKAKRLQNLFGSVSSIEKRMYPLCAKKYLSLEGLSVNFSARNQNISEYFKSFDEELEQLQALVAEYKEMISHT